MNSNAVMDKNSEVDTLHICLCFTVKVKQSQLRFIRQNNSSVSRSRERNVGTGGTRSDLIDGVISEVAG